MLGLNNLRRKAIKASCKPICRSSVSARSCLLGRKNISSVTINKIDHLVLTVKDINETINFYSKVLGMEPITFGPGRKALHFGEQKLNLHQKGNEFDPKAKEPTPGAIDICLISNSCLEEVMDHLREHNVEVEEGPVQRTGAVGKITSVYVRDPDQNLIEISTYN